MRNKKSPLWLRLDLWGQEGDSVHIPGPLDMVSSEKEQRGPNANTESQLSEQEGDHTRRPQKANNQECAEDQQAERLTNYHCMLRKEALMSKRSQEPRHS